MDSKVKELYEKARKYRNCKNYDQAINTFTKALKIAPDEADIYAGRGSTYMQMHQYQEAIQDYNEAIERASEHPGRHLLFFVRGGIYLHIKAYEKAIADYTKAIELIPWHFDYYYCRGVAYKAMGRLTEAKEDFQRTLEIWPSHKRVAKSLSEVEILLNSKKNEEVKSMPNQSEKESVGKTKGLSESRTQELIRRGWKVLPPQRGVRVRLFENPKVPPSSTDSTKPRILAVDDDSTMLSAIASYFHNEGFEIYTALNSEEALVFLSKKSVDVVITGIVMPGMNGLELTKIIKKKYDIEVIILTGGGSTDSNKEEAHRLGVFDFITKPCRLDDLLKCVKKAYMR